MYSSSSNYILCYTGSEFYNMHYTLHQPKKEERRDKLAICVHGLTRNETDFNYLVTHLASEFTLICPDVVGRGRSDWLRNKQDYAYHTYCASLATLMSSALQMTGAKGLDWIGTSMGGIIGIMLASCPNSPIKKLVLNDIGAFIPKDGLLRIATYSTKPSPQFASLEEVIQLCKEIYKPFCLTEDQWPELAKNTTKKEANSDGQVVYKMHYDPEVTIHSRDLSKLQEVSLWTFWDTIRCPVMVIRGKDSDILPIAVVEEMRKRGPGIAEYVEIENVGHAPSLMQENQVAPIARFLLAP